MKKKKTILTIIAALFLMIFVSCSDINPFFAGGVLPGGNWIYFAEGSNIKKMRLDGSELESVFSLNNLIVRNIQLDPLNQKMYIFGIYNAIEYRIYEYNLDGSGQELVVDNGSSEILDIKIDNNAGRLYFATSTEIREINLGSGDEKIIMVGGFTSPFSLSPDYKGNIYYTNNGYLYKVSNQITTLLSLSPPLVTPGGITYNRNNDEIYVHDGVNIIRVAGATSFLVYTSGIDFNKSTEFYRIDNKLFLYRDDGGTVYELCSINRDGTGFKTIYTNNSGIGGFDILSK